MADGIDLYAVFLGPLESLGLEYFVTGSVASSAYGEPRFTQDIDLVLSLAPNRSEVFQSAFPAAEFYVPPEATLREELGRTSDGHFNLLHHESGVRADVYVLGRDPLHVWAMEHRRRIDLAPSLSTWLAPPEYVVVRKLAWRAEGGGERHESDIRSMLRSLGEHIDLDFVTDHADRGGFRDLWDRLRS